MTMDAQRRNTLVDLFQAHQRKSIVGEEEIGTDVIADSSTTLLASHIVERIMKSPVNPAQSDFIGTLGKAMESADDPGRGISCGRKCDRVSAKKMSEHLRAGFAERAMAARI